MAKATSWQTRKAHRVLDQVKLVNEDVVEEEDEDVNKEARSMLTKHVIAGRTRMKTMKM